MKSAVETVFSTRELLEAILIESDVLTILICANRVSRLWNHIISISPTLQRMLFFLPEEQQSETTNDDCAKTQNPFLRDIFPAWFVNARWTTSADEPKGDLLAAMANRVMGAYTHFLDLPLYCASYKATGNPFLYPNASWRRMLTSQPPCRTVATCRRVGALETVMVQPGKTRISYFQHGLRMGTLYDVTLRHVMAPIVTGFLVLWLDKHGSFEDFSDYVMKNLTQLPGAPNSLLQAIWNAKADMILQLTTTDGRHTPVRSMEEEFDSFWLRCGSARTSASELDEPDDHQLFHASLENSSATETE